MGDPQEGVLEVVIRLGGFQEQMEVQAGSFEVVDGVIVLHESSQDLEPGKTGRDLSPAQD